MFIINVAIFGVDQISQIIADVITKTYNQWLEERLGEKLNIVAFVTGVGMIPADIGRIGNAAILNPAQFAALYQQKIIDKIIFPREFSYGFHPFRVQLAKNGIDVNAIYLTNRLMGQIDVAEFIKPYLSAKYLPYIEFHIADHCNMNCKNCGHYSNLVKKPKFFSLEQYRKDFNQLKKFIDDVGIIRIMGGEPLLNPEVGEYVKLVRKIYPFAQVWVVTNALILQKMPEEFFDTLRKNNASIHISFYQPLENKMPAIKKLLEKEQIAAYIDPQPIKTFRARGSEKPYDDPREGFLNCGDYVQCNTIYEGKIAPCIKPFVIKYFNEYYHKNFPADGVLDLYEDGLTTEKLKRFLLTPFESCRYCTPSVEVKWERMS